jgi:hypothetical protein
LPAPRAPAHARLRAAGVSLRPLSGLPGDLEAFVDHYNHPRYYESINSVTSADVYFGRDKAILRGREKIEK